MSLFDRSTRLLIGLTLGGTVLTGRAHALPDCDRLLRDGASELPHSVYVSPLAEDAAYSPANPGRITEEHLPVLRELIQRAICAAKARQVPLASIRMTVIARSDDRGAREHIKKALQQHGVDKAQIDIMARSVVDTFAALHRARVLAERLREELRQSLRTDPLPGAIDPITVIQSSNPLGGAIVETGRLWDVPAQPHPRSFIVVVHQAAGVPASVSSSPPEPTPSQQTVINIYCGESGCSPGTRIESVPKPKRNWLGAPQVDALLGIAIGSQEYTRKNLYRELGWLGLGIRFPIWRFELGIRLSGLVSGQSVSFSHYQQEQLRLGAGAALQLGGLAVSSQAVRLALGIDVGYQFMCRAIERLDSVPPGARHTEEVHAPQADGWLRLEVPVHRVPRLAVSTELALGVMPFLSNGEWSPNLTTKILAGVAYAVR